MNLRLLIGGIFAAFVILSIASIFLFQNNLAKFLINPRSPYETYTPPAAPDYARQTNWLALPDAQSAGRVDVFYVAGTAYRSAAHWNAPLDDRQARETLTKVLLPNEAGPFADIGNIYAPHYRQATLFAFFTQKHQGREARKTAYGDVRRAFEEFLERRDENRPLILAGYDQGGLHVLGLLQDYFQDESELRRFLVAAYVIDQSTPLDLFNYILEDTPPCKYPADVRCVVSWNAYESSHEEEIWRKNNRLLVWDENGDLASVQKRPLLCTNPVDWRLSSDLVDSSEHLGAASLTGLDFDDRPALIEHAVSVQCDGGIAIVSEPRQRWLRRPQGFGKQWHSLDYNLFYEDIRVNLEERAIALATLLEQEDRIAPPMEDAIDLDSAPINPVPK